MGIKNIEVREANVEDEVIAQLKKMLVNVPDKSDLKTMELFAEHDVFSRENKVGTKELNFAKESEGTRMVFALSGPWFDTIKNGGTLIVDEFGLSLHTQLALELVKLFQQVGNTAAQLIVATHDTNLLRKELLRRDQIWFAEKDKYGSTDLYSLVEYKVNQAMSVRNDASYAKDYLLGKYGAIPKPKFT